MSGIYTTRYSGQFLGRLHFPAVRSTCLAQSGAQILKFYKMRNFGPFFLGRLHNDLWPLLTPLLSGDPFDFPKCQKTQNLKLQPLTLMLDVGGFRAPGSHPFRAPNCPLSLLGMPLPSDAPAPSPPSFSRPSQGILQAHLNFLWCRSLGPLFCFL